MLNNQRSLINRRVYIFGRYNCPTVYSEWVNECEIMLFRQSIVSFHLTWVTGKRGTRACSSALSTGSCLRFCSAGSSLGRGCVLPLQEATFRQSLPMFFVFRCLYSMLTTSLAQWLRRPTRERESRLRLDFSVVESYQ